MSNTIDALNWRYAVKKFDTKKISAEKLDIILEALRLTPSSLGLQAWKFLLVENPEVRKQLLPATFNQEQVIDASHLIVLARNTKLEEGDVKKWTEYLAQERNMPQDKKDGFHQMIMGYLSSQDDENKSIWLAKQLYIALGNLMTVCALEGIDSCPMEGLNPAQYDEILGLEEKGLKTVVVCPIGYRSADDPYQHEAKVRYPEEELFLRV
ncbi:NAD(P)H-dependent oxidoreductase [Lentimicrobium sp. L6]|uniref:NAD(P)H-dependent oxidoreductase n=1 Tax=Lentimicrobium sp. L6 TaxID=2735916 RepID=UPI0015555BA1|nr:NAD(P)H-dependent oxidoreductase [Lentimicrobium sp. L6]NPD85169.1 NAD(P)H-dependent oxidoreductase [Lentimicrobium sp. L6]